MERLPSVRPPPPPRVAGTAQGASGDHDFEVSGAQRLSLEVSFPDDPRPADGALFAEVLVRVGGSLACVQLGRCRFEARDPAGPSGCSGKLVPLDAPINCRELFRHGRHVRIEDAFDQLPVLFARKEVVTPEFQRYTADLVYDLRVYRSLFDDIDAGLALESEATRAEVERVIIEGPGRRFMGFFDERLAALEQVVRRFTRQEHERHGFYFRRQVWDAILASPFLARTNIRPRGYAGDSMMMRYVYENRYLGEGLFGKLMHKHPIESAAAQAVRNRRKLITDTIVEARRSRQAGPGSPLRFLSVACGPAWEVADLFETSEDCDAYELALLDQDEEALAEAGRAVEAIERRVGCAVRARYLRESVRTMLRAPRFADAFGRYHVVYSTGLFDYLTTPVAKAVLGKLYELLEPGGRMIIGNYHVGNPTRWYMDYWMDWSLLYRTEDELLALAKDLPEATCEVSFEGTGSQMFLSVRRAAT